MRYYSSTAVVMALTGAVNEIVTTIVVDTVLGLPAQTPFTLVLDVGLSTEEIVTVTEVSGTNLTVTRGEDSSTSVAHTAGAIVRHMMTARDLRESAVHVDASANVHGIGATASVVGTDTAQTLTNKTINFADNTALGVPQASVTGLVADIAALAVADVGLVADVAALVLADADHAAAPTAHGSPFAERVVTATCATDGSFSGTFPAGVFTVTPLIQCTVNTATQFAFASAAALSVTAFSGHCAYVPGGSGGAATTAGFVIAVRAVQMTATTAVS